MIWKGGLIIGMESIDLKLYVLKIVLKAELVGNSCFTRETFEYKSCDIVIHALQVGGIKILW